MTHLPFFRQEKQPTPPLKCRVRAKNNKVPVTSGLIKVKRVYLRNGGQLSRAFMAKRSGMGF
jgi:hypothetical protein